MTIGFIGAGNMATALICGLIDGGMDKGTLAAFDVSEARMQAMRDLGIRTEADAVSLAESVDVTVLAVKPKHMAELTATLRGARLGDVLSIAVGWPQAMLVESLPGARGIAHAMPNTPALVREGVIALNENHTIDADSFSALCDILSVCGRIEIIPESLFDAVTGISGSGPAYVYMFIEAFGDAGVRQGLPREMAYRLAAQTLLGAAKMVLETGEHPGALKDAVTSPGGTTIEAVYALEKAGLRAAVMDAVDACARKAAAMAQK